MKSAAQYYYASKFNSTPRLNLIEIERMWKTVAVCKSRELPASGWVMGNSAIQLFILIACGII
jgi:hypothetical protein